MRKTFKYILAAAAAMFIGTVAADAQVVATKTAVDNGDDTYTLTLKSFSTGAKGVQSSVTRKPINAVLVLDVSGSMRNAVGDSYNPLAEANYSYSSYGNNSYYYKHTDGKYYKVNKGDTGGWGTTYYNLYFTVSSTKYYLTKSGVVQTAPQSITKKSTTIWSGVLYQKTTDNTTRLDALKSACQNFVDIVAADASENNVDHRISVVTFSDEASTKVTLESGNVRTSKTTVTNAINKITAGGNTYHGTGLDAAAAELSSAAADANATRLVILFTDGNPAPGGTDDFTTSIANTAIASAKSIKNDGKGTLIYSINVYPDSDAQMHKYMNYISSNFPDAESMSTAGDGTESSPKNPYYIFATSASQLNNVFGTIADDTTSGGSDIDFDSTQTEVKDILSSNFILPEGADASSVKVYLADFIKPTEGTTVEQHPVSAYQFGDRYAAPSTVTVTIPTEQMEDPETHKMKDYQTIVVKGFDFKNNWCGPITTTTTQHGETTTTVDWNEGKMLIFEFDIIPDPNAEGGMVYTNDPRSGVYYKDKKTGDFGNVVFNLPKPVYAPMDLKITKSGMKPGESAIFTVTRRGDVDFKYTVVMTADAEGNTEDAVIVKVDVKNDSGEAYVYTVEETSWSWAYTTDNPTQSHALYNGETPNNVFNFTNTAVEITPKHAEDGKKNVFKK